MTDVLTEEQRRLNMSRIRARDTGPELRLRRELFKMGVRGYRLRTPLTLLRLNGSLENLILFLSGSDSQCLLMAVSGTNALFTLCNPKREPISG